MGLYLHYQYLLGNFPKKGRRPRRNSFALKADLAKLDMINEETKLLFRHRIETAEQLAAFRDSKQADMDALASNRDILRKWMKAEKYPEAKDGLRKEIARLTAVLKACRYEIRLADDIAARSGVIRGIVADKPMHENKKDISLNRTQEEKKEAEKDERFR